MTCSIPRPTAQALFDQHKNAFQNVVLGGANVVPESNEWWAISVNYAASETYHAIADQAFKERDPRTACAANLLRLAADDGFYPLPAQPAQGYLKLTGTANTALPKPLQFTIDGKQYVTANNDTQVTQLDASGNAVVRVRAVVAGSVGNIKATTGNMTTSVTGVNASVEVCGGSFCIGEDAEGTEAFRQRYLRRKQYQPRATAQWMIDKFLEWPCVTRAMIRGGSCCGCGCGNAGALGSAGTTNCEDCGCVECGGKMNFYVMFDNSFEGGIAPSAVLEEIQEWMFGAVNGMGLGQVEIGVCGHVIQPTAVKVNVHVDIVDCPTASTLQVVKDVVKEFFTTVEPSKPVSSNELAAAVLRVLGTTADVDARMDLVTSSDGYGAAFGPKDENSKVYVTGCSMEPDCDYVLTLNETTITTSGTSAGGCP